MLFYGILVGIFLILFVISRYEQINIAATPRYLKPFYKISSYIIGKMQLSKGNSKAINKLKNKIAILYPEQNPERLARQMYYEKVGVAIAILFLGIIVSVIISVSQKSILQNENSIFRTQYLKRGQEITLRLKSEINKIEEDITFWVSAQEYDQEQLEQLYREFLPILETVFLDKNQTKDAIYFNVDCVEEIQGYPFEVEWKSNNYEIISNNGIVKNEYLSEAGVTLSMSATITYGEFLKQEELSLIVYAPQYTENEKFLLKVKEQLEEFDSASLYENIFYLPEVIDGVSVEWSDLENNQNIYIFLLFLGISIICYFRKEEDLKEKMKKREVELLWEYPTIVSKLTLYLSAGMTVKGAWVNVLKNGNLKDAPKVYGEMQMSCYEMDCGVSEILAYEKFGRRCALQPYIKLTALLVQNIEKGNSILLQRLKEETQLAFIERKNKAKIKAEEASTKLLLPMIIFMGIVMIMIMVPAFQQF